MLHEVGLKRTAVRVGVLAMLSGERGPMSAGQILARLPKGTDTVTLYRTLKSFAEKKLVHRVRGDDQVWRYGMGDLKARRHEHAHFVCDGCGTVECLPEKAVGEKRVKRAGLGEGYSVAYSEVLVHGTCPDCSG
jgi:Fur family ferric uptake transcriptional regulator